MNAIQSDDPLSLRNWIVNWLTRELELAPDEVNVDENLLVLGVDSINAIMLVGDLEILLGIRLPTTLLWDAPTVTKLVARLIELKINAPRLPANLLPSNQGTEKNPIAGGSPRGVEHSLETVSIEQARRLLEQLDQLSDADVETLLRRLSQE